jgi:hypothetical protein
MKVDFTVDEVWQMMDNVVEQLTELKLSKKDLASLRRWRSDDMSPRDPLMRLLSEKVNSELGRVAERNEVSPLKKPDWA